jgi:surfeit locus 1 family protein
LQGIVLLDQTEPFGFERIRQRNEFGPERHVGYAVQWFGLALTVLIIYFVVNFKRRSVDG